MATDITKPASVENAHPSDRGTGIFWFLDQKQEFEQVFVPNIKRSRAKELANIFNDTGPFKLDAYRWVPDHVEDIISLMTKPCGGICKSDIDCVDNACRCIRGSCRRKGR